MPAGAMKDVQDTSNSKAVPLLPTPSNIDPSNAQTCHGTPGKSFPLCALVFSDVKSGTWGPWLWSMGGMWVLEWGGWPQETALVGAASPAWWV